MCPDWELNQRPFVLQAYTQSTEPHQPVHENPKILALTGVGHLVACHPAKQKVAGSIPGLGKGLGSGPECKRQQIDDVSLTHQCFSLSLPPSLPPSLKINK